MGLNNYLEELYLWGNKIVHFDLGTNKSLKNLKINMGVVKILVADEFAIIPKQIAKQISLRQVVIEGRKEEMPRKKEIM